MKGLNADGEMVDFTHKCSKCGRWLPLPEWAGKFCPSCGTKQEAPPPGPRNVSAPQPVCPGCGARVEQSYLFCPACGKAIPAVPGQVSGSHQTA